MCNYSIIKMNLGNKKSRGKDRAYEPRSKRNIALKYGTHKHYKEEDSPPLHHDQNYNMYHSYHAEEHQEFKQQRLTGEFDYDSDEIEEFERKPAVSAVIQSPKQVLVRSTPHSSSFLPSSWSDKQWWKEEHSNSMLVRSRVEKYGWIALREWAHIEA